MAEKIPLSAAIQGYVGGTALTKHKILEELKLLSSEDQAKVCDMGGRERQLGRGASQPEIMIDPEFPLKLIAEGKLEPAVVREHGGWGEKMLLKAGRVSAVPQR